MLSIRPVTAKRKRFSVHSARVATRLIAYGFKHCLKLSRGREVACYSKCSFRTAALKIDFNMPSRQARGDAPQRAMSPDRAAPLPPPRQWDLHLSHAIIDSRFTAFIVHTHIMADDTRQPNRPQKKNLSREALTIHPDHKRFSGSQWDDPKSQITKPPENANMMPGGTEHTAGGKTPEVSIKEAFPKLDDWSRFHKLPCVRNALLYGMTTGFALAGMRVIFSGECISQGDAEVLHTDV